MQEVAWNTVTSLTTWTGVSATLTTESYDKEDFEVYPNPPTTVLNVKNLKNYSIENIKIINFSGKIVFEKSEDLKVIPIEKLAAGIYVVEIMVGSKINLIKFIKHEKK